MSCAAQPTASGMRSVSDTALCAEQGPRCSVGGCRRQPRLSSEVPWPYRCGSLRCPRRRDSRGWALTGKESATWLPQTQTQRQMLSGTRLSRSTADNDVQAVDAGAPWTWPPFPSARGRRRLFKNLARSQQTRRHGGAGSRAGGDCDTRPPGPAAATSYGEAHHADALRSVAIPAGHDRFIAVTANSLSQWCGRLSLITASGIPALRRQTPR